MNSCLSPIERFASAADTSVSWTGKGVRTGALLMPSAALLGSDHGASGSCWLFGFGGIDRMGLPNPPLPSGMYDSRSRKRRICRVVSGFCWSYRMSTVASGVYSSRWRESTTSLLATCRSCFMKPNPRSCLRC
eukprot:2864174-Prymnesium_polylepis.1